MARTWWGAVMAEHDPPDRLVAQPAPHGRSATAHVQPLTRVGGAGMW
jgi:hypothetical protein